MQIRKVPFQALGGLFEQDDIDAALKVMQAAAQPGGSFFPLPEETDFQDALAGHEGGQKAVIVNSCGTALDLCMMALGIKEGHEVIVPRTVTEFAAILNEPYSDDQRRRRALAVASVFEEVQIMLETLGKIISEKAG